MANQGGFTLHCLALRVAKLDQFGATPADGGGVKSLYVTDKLNKLDFNPDLDAGPEVSNRAANGQLCQVFRLPDILKRLNISIEICTQDPELEAVLSAGTVLLSSGTPLPSMGTVTPSTATTGGILAAGTYSHKVTALSAYGEGLPSTATSQVTTGSNSTVTLNWAAVVGALGYKIYGRLSGSWGLIGTNTGNGNISFVDTGSITPGVSPPTVDTTGVAVNGYQYPKVGIDPQPNGVSVEAWTRTVLSPSGVQPVQAPYMRWVFPRMFLHKGNRTIDINPMATMMDGYAVENTAWGNGPNNDYPYDSTAVCQWIYDTVLPTPVLGGAQIPTQV